MALSRLDNFLKNYEGNLIYVNPTDFDSTDSYDNQGNSLTRPFKTIQRALIEAARFSYQSGRNNDKIDKTTILVYPGTHYIDNRPGYSIQSINNAAVVKRKTDQNTWVSASLPELNKDFNFDILSTNNDLYKFNSVNGGVILPRGTSIIGLDLRKTKVRPLYVPDPENDTVDNSSIFNVTGTCYFTAFTFFDASPTTTVFKDYTTNRFVPEFSHHKLVAFAYADGVNKVKLGYEQTNLTDLDMYYYKISEVYGQITGRPLGKYPSSSDFETVPGEFTIVGNVQANPLGISSIFAGDGLIPTSTVTVTTKDFLSGEPKAHGLQVDSPILINGVTVDPGSYNGSFTVKEVVGLTTFTYTAISTPVDAAPLGIDSAALDTASVVIESDTVRSASPYVFNCSLRSVYGLCGMWADGNKADGFKSMVVAQFTGISLQKDENAFLIYDNSTYYDNLTLAKDSIRRPLHTNSSSLYKPKYKSYHIRCSNGAFIQCVSVFAIGYARHFYAESGGDMSITNSNSNFGSVSLESSGYRSDSFDRDDVGYITHIIPPKEILPEEISYNWVALDGDKIRTAGPLKERLYLNGYNDINNPPLSQVSGYRVGARDGDKLYVNFSVGLAQTTSSAPILMPVPSGNGISARKKYSLGRQAGINSISSDVFTLTTNHQLLNGESVRVFSDTGQAPSGLKIDSIYYAITNGLNSDQLQLALSYNDALSGNGITGIGNNGGVISFVSTVSDKVPGDVGHPVAFDADVNNWYINSSKDSSNQISSTIIGLAVTTKTNDTFIYRKSDDRLVDDRIYKVRYVVPKEYLYARIPTQGFVLQESKSVGVSTVSYTNVDLSRTSQLKNERVIVNATAGLINNNSQIVTITTEVPHNFGVGDKVTIQKVQSSNNPDSLGITSTYNGSYYIDSVPSLRTFTYTISGVSTNPGTFSNAINFRSTASERIALPLVSRTQYKDSYRIYKVDVVKKHIPGDRGQDGIYHLTLLSSNAKSAESVGYGISNSKYSQDIRDLYPQIDRDNLNTDPVAAISYADELKVSNVITDDKKKSITKESLDLLVKNTGVGFGITGISISGVGNTTVKIFTDREHQLNAIKSFNIVSNGSGFPISTSIYSASLVDKDNKESATANFKTTAGGSVDSNTFSLVYNGSACGIGSTYVILSSGTNALIQVTDIVNNVGDGFEVFGFNNSDLKGIFKIQNVDTNNSFIIYVPNGVNNYNPNTNGYIPSGYLSSKGVGITSFSFTDVISGFVTVTTATPHGLEVGNRIRITETGTTLYNNDFVVSTIVGLNTVTFNVGIATTTVSSTKGILFKRGFASNSSIFGTGQEGRATHIYSGISTTTTSAFITNSTTIQLSSTGGFKRGDYLSIGNEIIRLSSIPSGNTFKVLRSQLGTFRESNIPSGSLVRKIKILPVEFRRPSFLRASGHTFEYLGYGPGNYSNSLPQKQSRTLDSDEVKNSQARKTDSGLIVYSGVNDLGEIYSGTKKTLYTGQDVVVDAPIVTFTGDDASQQLGNLVNSDFDDVIIRRTLTVEGGPTGDLASHFYGPVNFTKRLTNNSNDGIEVRNLYISGKNVPQSKLFNVDLTSPTDSRLLGAISFLSTPSLSDGFIGNVYVFNPVTNSNEWRRFGLISKTANELNFQFDKLGIGVDNSNDPTYDFVVANNSQVNNLRITGTLSLDQIQTFNDVRFQDINVSGIATVQGYLNVTGPTNTKTLYASGISTFIDDANFNKNIGVGNTITVGNNIVFENSNSSIRWDVNSDFAFIRFNSIDDINPPSQLEIAVGDNGDSSGIADNLVVNSYDTTGSIVNSVKILDNYGNTTIPNNLGIGTTNPQTAKLQVLGTGALVYAYGNSSSNITHDFYALRTSSSTALGSGPNIRLDDGTLLNNVVIQNSQGNLTFWNYGANAWREILSVGYAGTITYTQNNSGKAASGANIIIRQKGSGDAVLTWRSDYLNQNQKWYAGIDVADGYTWKLAHPQNTVIDGTEDFANDTIFSIDIFGNASLPGNLSLPSIGTLNSTLTLRGGVSIAQAASIGSDTTIGGTLTINGGGGGTALTLNNGGDLVFYSAGNSGSASLFCDTNNQLKTNVNILSAGYIKSNSIGVNLLNPTPTGVQNLGYTNNNSSGGAYNFLRTDGSDTGLTFTDFVNCLGYIPQPPIVINPDNLPTGNSVLVDDISPTFDGINAIFPLTIGGQAFAPISPANLLVILGGVLQKPNTDFFVLVSGSSSQIRFTGAPVAGTTCFIIALGGQGSLKLNQDWSVAGEILVATADNTATTVPIGTNGQILTVDTSTASKVKWSSGFNGGVITGTKFKNYGEVLNNIGNTGTAATINLANGNFVTAVLTGNCTFTFVAGLTGDVSSFTLFLRNDATAGRSIIWPSSVKWPNSLAPVRTADANKADVYTFYTFDNGTTWYGNLAHFNYA